MGANLLSPPSLRNLVIAAIKAGYRHFQIGNDKTRSYLHYPARDIFEYVLDSKTQDREGYRLRRSDLFLTFHHEVAVDWDAKKGHRVPSEPLKRVIGGKIKYIDLYVLPARPSPRPPVPTHASAVASCVSHPHR